MRTAQGKRIVRAALAILMVTATCMCLSACSRKGVAVDPGQWGYDCQVTYDALGGVINTRAVRTTFYMQNSYVFEPSGSANMLVEPLRDGHMLAGWYTAKEDGTGEDGAPEYQFRSEDRWDFDLDRVQGDMTLYARWIPRGKVDYIDAGTGDVLFTKNITADSPVQPLSSAVLGLSGPKDKTLFGYYADEACTVPYDFSAYHHAELIPSDAELYATLAAEFPQVLEPREYVEPEETDEENADALDDTSYLFIEKLGYALLDTSEEAVSALRARKDELIEQAIAGYIENTASRKVYMKFIDGNYILVSSLGDLKVGGQYGFFDEDAKGKKIDGYVLVNDVDCAKATFAMSPQFSGTVHGQGFTLSNITLSVTSRKVDADKEKFLALAEVMDGAVFNDVTFDGIAIKAALTSGVKFNAALLALDGKNVTLNNCVFKGFTIDTGAGDDGKAAYTLGDLFVTETGCKLSGCTLEPIDVTASAQARLRFHFFEKLDKPEETEDPAATPNP